MNLNITKYNELLKLAKSTGYIDNSMVEEEKPYKEYYNFKYKNVKDIKIIAGLVYSWMPTMLDFYFEENYDWDKLKKLINRFFKNDDTCRYELLSELSTNINHSIVGASKVLHILKPEYAPIIDSRVIKAWNTFFKDTKEFKLINFPFCNKNGIINKKQHDRLLKVYIEKYWDNLLSWGKNINKTVRDIEFLFYWIGGTSIVKNN
jgi:hypothetical protein